MLALAIEFTGDPVGLASSADSAVAAPPGRRRRKRRFGGYSGGETPGPIPNPEVKPSSADGTALETGWESRSPPRHLRHESRLRAALVVWAEGPWEAPRVIGRELNATSSALGCRAWAPCVRPDISAGRRSTGE